MSRIGGWSRCPPLPLPWGTPVAALWMEQGQLPEGAQPVSLWMEQGQRWQQTLWPVGALRPGDCPAEAAGREIASQWKDAPWPRASIRNCLSPLFPAGSPPCFLLAESPNVFGRKGAASVSSQGLAGSSQREKGVLGPPGLGRPGLQRRIPATAKQPSRAHSWHLNAVPASQPQVSQSG